MSLLTDAGDRFAKARADLGQVSACFDDNAAKLQACSDAQAADDARCDADNAARLATCGAIQCTSFTNCGDIQCTDYTNCDSYSVFDPRRYACYIARAACVAAKAIESAACYVARAACVAAAAVARAACIAASAVVLAACKAAAWVKGAACKAGVVGASVLCAAGKVVDAVINVVIGAVETVVGTVLGIFGGGGGDGDGIEDTVPDLSGVNFDRPGVPFLWGVSTAAHQVEGVYRYDPDGTKHEISNDWHIFGSSHAIKDRVENLGSLGSVRLRVEDADRAVDHWKPEVLGEDLDRARALGMNAYRFSIEWARLQPDRPQWVTDHLQATRSAKAEAAAARKDLEAAAEAEKHGRKAEAAALRASAKKHEDRKAAFEKAAAQALQSYSDTDFDQAALAAYLAMITAMTDRGLQPILTLNHMSLPGWVLTPPKAGALFGLGAVEDGPFRESLRGWENPLTVKAFGKLVRFVVPRVKDSVRYWVTVNEPVGSVTVAGYLAGVWPPGFLGDAERAKRVYFNLIEAHVLAYDTIKELAGPDAQVGFSQQVFYVRPAPQTILSKIIGSNVAATNQFKFAYNLYFLDAVTKGDFNPNLWRKDTPTHKDEWANRLDFVAPQYYRAADIYFDTKVALGASWSGGDFVEDIRTSTDEYLLKYLCNDLGWTIYPGGFYRVLKEYSDRYQLPILITENGTAEFQDRNRAAYTIAHLQQVLRAIKDGIDVIGYVHWSIVDNYEWAFDYMGEARFGLFTVDRTVDPDQTGDPSFPRHITEGALALQYVIANSRRIARTGSGENPFDAPVARFGTISPDGLAVQPMEQLAGALWSGSYPAGDGPDFMLYLSRLGTEWLGMLFRQDAHRWVPLQNVSWDERTLSFDEPEGAAVYQWSAAAPRRSGGAAPAPLAGTASRGGAARQWTAARVTHHGIWKERTGKSGLTHIGLSQFEGGFQAWTARTSPRRSLWRSAGDPLDWTGDHLRLGLAKDSTFDGTATFDRLTGTITTLTRRTKGPKSTKRPWDGSRIADDVPF